MLDIYRSFRIVGIWIHISRTLDIYRGSYTHKTFTIHNSKTYTHTPCVNTILINNVYIARFPRYLWGKLIYPLRGDPPDNFVNCLGFMYTCRYLSIKTNCYPIMFFNVFGPGISRKRDVYRRFPFFRPKTAFETTHRDGR